ncbi:expressed unknown protein [Seminavis robusta]|uniref:Transmembrane protein n=1 Tax=Seminavis robusta TaxID=568900 RepID=A0A9N8HN08_9STRA|nr:expressed unknown protein [Seminavis robusta]|eukprot:Sro787_g202360.1 n/a (207) ;mRNA; f:25641-26261
MGAPAYRPHQHQYRSSLGLHATNNARANRTILWLKQVVFWLIIFVFLLMVFESLWASEPEHRTTTIETEIADQAGVLHVGTIDISIENFSSEDTPEEEDDAVPDTFYFVGGKPVWFDATLEGRWATLKQQFMSIFWAPTVWQPARIPHREMPGPETLTQTQLLLMQEEEEGFEPGANEVEPFRRRSIRGTMTHFGIADALAGGLQL